MKNIIIPVKFVNKQRRVFNEGIYSDKFSEFKNECRAIYNTLQNPEFEVTELYSKVLNFDGNKSNEHAVVNINSFGVRFIFVNVDKILQFHSVESIARSLINSENVNA